MIEYFLIIAIGLEFGSFANVCIYRWPRNGSVVHPSRSKCPWCEVQIPWYDNIPVLSYILLSARCRSCKSPIALRYPLVELALPIMWLASYLMIKDNPNYSPFFLFTVFVFCFVVLVTTLTDIDFKIIPDEMSYFLIVIGILTAYSNPLLFEKYSINQYYSAIIGGCVGWGSLALISYLGKIFFKKEVMGGGDLKLLAGFGTILGPQDILVSVVLASFIGGVLASIGLALGKLKRNQYIPFGPFINVSCLAILVIRLTFPNLLLRVLG